MSVSSSAPSAHTSPSSWGLNDRLISLMESIYAIIAGLGLRYVVDTVSRHDFKITGTLVGLWEGVILLHFLKKLPKSTDPYLAFAVRLFIDFLVTESVSRLVLVLTWTGMGMILADVAPAIWEDMGLRRVWRRFRRDLYIISESVPTVVFFPPTRTVRFSPSREPSVIAEAEEEEEEEPNADAHTEARSVESSTSAGLTEQETPANVEPPIRRRLPGYFPGMLSDTESVLSSVLSHNIHLPSTLQRDSERTSRRLSVYPRTTDHNIASETSSQRNDEDEIKLSSSTSSQSTVTGPADTTRFTDDLRITEDFDTTQLTDIPDEVLEEQKPAATTEKEKDQKPEVDTRLGLKPPNVPFFLPPTPSDSQPPLRRRLPRDDQPRPSSVSIPQIPDMPEFPSDGWEKIQKEDANDAEHPWEQVQREDAVDVDGPPPLPPKDWLDMSHLEPFLATTSTNTYDRAGLGETTIATNDEHRDSQPPPYFDHVDDHEDIYEDHPSDVKVLAAVAGGSPAPGLADLSTLSNRHVDEMRITQWLEQDAAQRRLEEEAEQRRNREEAERKQREKEEAEAEAEAEAQRRKEEEEEAAEKRRKDEEAERKQKEAAEQRLKDEEAERRQREKEEAEQKRKEEEAAEQRRKDEEAETKRLEKKAAEQKRKEEETKRQKEAAERRLKDEEARKKLQEEEAEKKRKEDEAAETKRLEELEKKRMEEEKKRQDEAAEQQRKEAERLEEEEEEEKRKAAEQQRKEAERLEQEEEEKRKAAEQQRKEAERLEQEEEEKRKAAEQQRKEAERLEQEKRNEEAEKKRKEEEAEKIKELEKEIIEKGEAEARREEQEAQAEQNRREEAATKPHEEAKTRLKEEEQKQKQDEAAEPNRPEEEATGQGHKEEADAGMRGREMAADERPRQEITELQNSEEEKKQRAELQSPRQAETAPTPSTSALVENPGAGGQSAETVNNQEAGNDDDGEQHRMETESVATNQSTIPSDVESRVSRILLMKAQIVEIQSRIRELGAPLEGAGGEGTRNELEHAQKVLEKLKRKERRGRSEGPGLKNSGNQLSLNDVNQMNVKTCLLEKLEELLSPDTTSLRLTIECATRRAGGKMHKPAVTEVLDTFKLLGNSTCEERLFTIDVSPEKFSAWVTEYRASITQSDDMDE